jgi:hypothetical protein
MKDEYPHLNTCRFYFHQYFSWLKDYDLFKIHVSNNFNFERHDHIKKKATHSHNLGSYLGGLVSIVVQSFFLFYGIFLII